MTYHDVVTMPWNGCKELSTLLRVLLKYCIVHFYMARAY